MPLTLQVSNPVASFTTDNNGVIIQLPAVGASGSAAVSGSLIFGIGTQSNNGLGTAKVFMLGSSGELTTNYKGTPLTMSFIDSGSNAYYFPDTITACTTNTGFYCPTSTLALMATMISPVNGTSESVSFNVANADNLFASGTKIAAAGNLAANSTTINDPNAGNSTFNGSNSFDWGLPFYFGRSVFTAIEGQNTSAGMGPYFAF
jgi:hypothetical protein